jgi:outer membrane receptor protein involved in Fe transport
MHRIFSILLLLALITTSLYSQSQGDDMITSISEKILVIQSGQPASLRGKITDKDNNELQGASVVIIGTEKGVNTNYLGQYFIDKLHTGKVNIQASIMGYETQIAEIMVQPGVNELNFTLVENIIHLDPVTVIAQKREQQILDVPAAISVVGSELIENANIVELGQLSEYVPGLNIIEQGANRPTFVIRGLTSEEVSPSAQPRVSVYYNNVPINRANGASVALYDMDRVEVLKGPQNTLFGRGSQIGVIHFISQSPSNITGGYLSAGIGNFNQREFRGAIDVPLIENKLLVRAAGLYDFREGFVENTFGGTLNGINTLAGRLSMRFLPAKNHKMDLILSYQNDDTPGIAFMSKQFPNTAGDTDIFSYRASLEQGENLGTGKKLFDATLYYKYNINEHTYWSSITSYRKSTSSARWDGDGTAAPALDFRDDAGADQFYQEIRYNFSLRSRLNGSAGASYWYEKADQTYWFSPNEQSMAVLFFNPDNLILPDGQPLLLPALPDDPALGPLAGMPLPANHQENNSSAATNQAMEAFADLTYHLTSEVFLSGGLRMAYENFKLSNEAAFTDGTPSTLGLITGNHPNVFFKPSAAQSINNNNLSLNWQAGIQYKFSENTNIFANYSNGRRPVVLQFTSTGEPEELPAERVDNFDVGVKSLVSGRVFIDAVAFYQKYKNFQTRAWIADPETGEFNYKSINGGMATSYGAETSINVSLLKGLELFGNYAYLNATFDDTDKDGSEQEYAGNLFRWSPKHTFSLGFNAKTSITSKFNIFMTPSYAFKSDFFFEDANTEGLDQPEFGLLNINLGIELTNPNIILNIYGTNLLNEQFIISAGNTGSLFGVPTFVPGPPRMMGTRLTWKF